VLAAQGAAVILGPAGHLVDLLRAGLLPAPLAVGRGVAERFPPGGELDVHPGFRVHPFSGPHRDRRRGGGHWRGGGGAPDRLPADPVTRPSTAARPRSPCSWPGPGRPRGGPELLLAYPLRGRGAQRRPTCLLQRVGTLGGRRRGEPLQTIPCSCASAPPTSFSSWLVGLPRSDGLGGDAPGAVPQP